MVQVRINIGFGLTAISATLSDTYFKLIAHISEAGALQRDGSSEQRFCLLQFTRHKHKLIVA